MKCITCDTEVDSVNVYGLCEYCVDKASEYEAEAREAMHDAVREALGDDASDEDVQAWLDDQRI